MCFVSHEKGGWKKNQDYEIFMIYYFMRAFCVHVLHINLYGIDLVSLSQNTLNNEIIKNIYIVSGIYLTHWGQVMHICISKLPITASGNGLPPGRRQASTWTYAHILSIRNLRTNLSEISSEILTFSFEKIHLKTSFGKWRPFRIGLNLLKVFTVTMVAWLVATVIPVITNLLRWTVLSWERYL